MRRTLLSLCMLGLAAPSAARAQVRWPGRAPAVTASGQRALDLGEALLLGASLPDRWLPQGAVLVQGAAPTRATMRALGVQHLDRALDLLPDDAHAHALAAEAYAHLRQLPRAELHARRSLALDARGPDAPGAWFVLALVYTLRGQHAEARDAYLAELAFPLRPTEASVVWGNLAETWVSLRQLPEAVEAFTRAVALDPDHALAWLGLALARDRLGASPWDDARRAHDAASGRATASRSPRLAPFAPRLDLDALVAAAPRRGRLLRARLGPLRVRGHRLRVCGAYAAGVCRARPRRGPRLHRARPRGLGGLAPRCARRRPVARPGPPSRPAPARDTYQVKTPAGWGTSRCPAGNTNRASRVRVVGHGAPQLPSEVCARVTA
jgi:Flp pilus assembly protein TadD